MAMAKNFKLLDLSGTGEYYNMGGLFDIKDKCIILSTNEITTKNVERLMLNNLGKFPDGSRFTIFAGSHGSEDGTFGETTDKEQGSMIQDYRRMVRRIKNKKADIIKEKKYKLQNVIPVGLLVGFEDELEEVLEDSVEPYMDQILKDEDPHVIILAFCYTNVNVLLCKMMELGVLSVLAAKMERGLISNGTCHALSQGQRKPMAQIKEDHIEHKDGLDNAKSRNIFLYGSPGTGKTILIKLFVRMRVEFYKRLLQKTGASTPINVIIAVYREDAVQLMEEFKKDFSDLVGDPKIKEEFKSFGIE